MDTKVHASLDRIEEGRLVCYTDDDRLFTLPAEEHPGFHGGEAVLLTLEDGRAVDIELLAEETAENEKKVKSLFSALLRKKKK